MMQKVTEMWATHRYCANCGSSMTSRKQGIGLFDRFTGKRPHLTFWRCSNWRQMGYCDNIQVEDN